MDNDLTLLELIDCERDPQLRKVLEQYRGAEIELNAAAERLEKLGRVKWSLAAAQRARDIAWQAQRYMRFERRRYSAEHPPFISDEEVTPLKVHSGGWSEAPPLAALPLPMAAPSKLPLPQRVHRYTRWAMALALLALAVQLLAIALRLLHWVP